MRVLIDCFNLSVGGGLKHLKDILNNYQGKEVLIVCAPEKVLSKIRGSKKIIKISHNLLNKSLFHRIFWHLFLSKDIFKKYDCDIAFYPGGINASGIKKYVTMSRNMLPFSISEVLRFKSPFFICKLLLIRLFQSYGFKNSSGIIFLNEYARNRLSKFYDKKKLVKIIPHGHDPNSSQFIKPKLNINQKKNFLYVSHFTPYKNHLNVLKAFSIARRRYKDIKLSLLGSFDESYESCKRYVENNDLNDVVEFHDAVHPEKVQDYYVKCDCFIFASSCENYPNILNEVQNFSFDILCSYLPPMPSILKNRSLYFNPHDAKDIERCLNYYLSNDLPKVKWNAPKLNTWMQCQQQTFDFIKEVNEKYEL